MNKTIPKLIAWWLLTGALALAPSYALFATGSAPQAQTFDEAEYREIATELRCPSCEGLSILESQASFSIEMREEVRRQLIQSKSKEQILEFFVERYGSWILRKPPLRGISLIIWLLPTGLALLGIILGCTLFLRRGAGGTPSARAQNSSPRSTKSREALHSELMTRVARARAKERGPS